MSEPCPFCEIVAGRAPAEVVARGENDIIIVPLNPVVPGHVIVIPHMHVTDVTDDPMVSGAVFRATAWFTKNRGPKSFNLITSVGAAATQTVKHLHVHIVPRSADDGLALPWTPDAIRLPPLLAELEHKDRVIVAVDEMRDRLVYKLAKYREALERISEHASVSPWPGQDTLLNVPGRDVEFARQALQEHP